jgi:hypothetical protein
MSLVTYTVRCDWPGCIREETFQATSILRDYWWCGRHYDNPTTDDHLCPEHRFKTWEELDEARESVSYEG